MAAPENEGTGPLRFKGKIPVCRESGKVLEEHRRSRGDHLGALPSAINSAPIARGTLSPRPPETSRAQPSSLVWTDHLHPGELPTIPDLGQEGRLAGVRGEAGWGAGGWPLDQQEAK